MNRGKVGCYLSMTFLLTLAVIAGGCGKREEKWTHGESSSSQMTEELGEKITESEADNTVKSEQVPPPVELSASESSSSDIVEEVLSFPADMPSTFVLSSGAGGWSTTLTIQPNGSFCGVFSDSDLGTTGDDYPYGTVYYCNFNGKLEVTEQLDEYSYALKLTALEEAQGEEYIEDEIRYVPSEPYGMERGKNYILYLPETPLEKLSEEFLLWWPGRYDMDNQDLTTLDCFGLHNRETEYGFFSEAE